MGLALAKGIIELHGGKITAESSGVGGGSVFTISLPLPKSGGVAAAADVPGGGVESQSVHRRVLVVDDNLNAVQSLALLLEALGHRIMTAADGLEAVSRAEQFLPEIVLMDLGLPKLDGLDAARQIRRQPWSQGMKIIAVTGWGQPTDKQKSRAAGCDTHVVKPISLTKLKRLLH